MFFLENSEKIRAPGGEFSKKKHLSYHVFAVSSLQIRKAVKQGSGLWSSLLPLSARMALPTIGKTLGLSALAGLASEGASQAVKSITGKGVQTGGFIVKPNMLQQLMPYVDMLTKGQLGSFLQCYAKHASIHHSLE